MSFTIPGKIIEEYGVRNNRLGLVQFGDTCRPIFLDLVPDAKVGDFVRVHVGFATERVSAEEAKQAYDGLGKNGQLKTAELVLEAEKAMPDAVRRLKPR